MFSSKITHCVVDTSAVSASTSGLWLRYLQTPYTWGTTTTSQLNTMMGFKGKQCTAVSIQKHCCKRTTVSGSKTVSQSRVTNSFEKEQTCTEMSVLYIKNNIFDNRSCILPNRDLHSFVVWESCNCLWRFVKLCIWNTQHTTVSHVNYTTGKRIQKPTRLLL